MIYYHLMIDCSMLERYIVQNLNVFMNDNQDHFEILRRIKKNQVISKRTSKNWVSTLVIKLLYQCVKGKTFKINNFKKSK